MINLDTILSELFEDRTARQLLEQLDAIGVTNHLRKAVIQINELISKQDELLKEEGIIPIGSLVANLLSSINNQLRNSNITEKKEAEYILSEIIRKLILEMMSRFAKTPKNIAFQLGFALEKTCHFYDYDVQQLLQYLKLPELLRELRFTKAANKLGNKSSTAIPALIWKGRPNSLPDFVDLLADMKLLNSRKGFNSLFNLPKTKLTITMNEQKTEEILLLFAYVKKKRLISFSGCRSIYDALKYHVLDFENKFLLSKTPQERLNRIKNNKRKYQQQQELIENWISGIEM